MGTGMLPFAAICRAWNGRGEGGVRTLVSGLVVLVLATAIDSRVSSQENPTGSLTPSPPGAAVYFINLKDGATVTAKATIRFGLRGMGVAPAGIDANNTGHHHLLIDAELPSLGDPIPDDANHLHFGAGQTEAEVTLTPGPHTLQLVLGDKNHVPHSPPVMSEPIHVNVVEETAPQADAETVRRHPSPPDAKVYFIYPTDGAVLMPTVTIRFGLLNMGVAPAGFEKINTGHHHLLIDAPLPPMDQPIPNDLNHLHFGAGQTEARIRLTPGKHTLILLLGDDKHMPHDPPVVSKPIRVTVLAPRPQIRPPSSHDQTHARTPVSNAQ